MKAFENVSYVFIYTAYLFLFISSYPCDFTSSVLMSTDAILILCTLFGLIFFVKYFVKKHAI